MSRVKGAPWEFKANAGDDVSDCVIPERTDVRNSASCQCEETVQSQSGRGNMWPDERISRMPKGHGRNRAIMHRGHAQ